MPFTDGTQSKCLAKTISKGRISGYGVGVGNHSQRHRSGSLLRFKKEDDEFEDAGLNDWQVNEEVNSKCPWKNSVS